MMKVLHISLIASLLFFQEQQSLASGAREYFNYELKDGPRVVYRGQTNDLYRRGGEHWRDGKEFTHMRKIGKSKTKKGALKAEKASLETYRKSHGGLNPKYNQTNHG